MDRNIKTNYSDESNLIIKDSISNSCKKDFNYNKNNSFGYAIVVNRTIYNRNKSNVSNKYDKKSSSSLNAYELYNKCSPINSANHKKVKNIIKRLKKINENKKNDILFKNKIGFISPIFNTNERDLGCKASLDQEEQTLIEKQALENLDTIINGIEVRKYFYENENCTDLIKIGENYNNKVIPISIEEKLKSEFLDEVENLITKKNKIITVNRSITLNDNSRMFIKNKYKTKINIHDKLFYRSLTKIHDGCKSVYYLNKSKNVKENEELRKEIVFDEDNWNINQLGESSLYKDAVLIEF